jgi:hypothetical protein
MIPGGYMQGIIEHPTWAKHPPYVEKKKIMGCNVAFDYATKLRPGLYTRYIICIDTYVCVYTYMYVCMYVFLWMYN